jgi:hypothetical protein
MSSYLQRLAQVFVQEVGEQLTEYTFVFPNRRAGLFFRRYLGQSLQRPIFSPEIMTINDCFASLSDLHVVDQLSLLVRLYDHYIALRPNGEPIERFLHWGKMMLADFSEVDNHLVQDVRALYAAVEDMRDIDMHFVSLNEVQLNAIKRFWGEFHDSWNKKENKTTHQNFLRTWQLLYPLYQQLSEELLSEGLAYEGLLHREVITHWDSIPMEKFRKHYVFIGFNALTESEKQLLLHLRDDGRADFYFDYEDSCVSDSNNRAPLFMLENQRLFRSKYIVPERKDTAIPSITHVSVTSTIAEAREVYQILANLYQDDKAVYDFTRTAVVLPDEQLLLPLLDCFPTTVQKINVTMGYPMRATSVYMPIAYPEQYFTSLPEEGSQMLALLRTEMMALRNSSNSDAVYQIGKVLDQLETVMHRYQHLPFSTEAVMQIVRMMTMDASIPYVGEPLDGLQVMGVLETRALDFDQLIITGFNDDLYPGKLRSTSFIPYTLRRGFDLPTPERQDAILAYNFYRMLSYAQRVWLISNTSADDTHSGEVSRYLYQLQWQYGYPITFEHVVSSLSTPEPKTTEIDKSTVSEEMARLKQFSFSASMLNKYLFCQKQFYFRYILGIKEPEQSEDVTITDATLGIVLHDVMQTLYTPFMKKQLLATDIQYILDSLNDRWNTLIPIEIQEDLLASNVIKNYVRNILQYDYTQAPFVLHGSECTVDAELFVPQIGTLRFYGKIDRIDQQNHDLRVIDYKTGAVEFVFKDMEHVFSRTQNQDKALQTLLYSWMLKNKRPDLLSNSCAIVPHIYPVRRMADIENVETRICAKGQSDFAYTPEIENEFLQGLSLLVQEIFDTNIPFTPTSDTKRCQSCAFYQLCKG